MSFTTASFSGISMGMYLSSVYVCSANRNAFALFTAELTFVFFFFDFIFSYIVTDSSTGKIKQGRERIFSWFLLLGDFSFMPFSILSGFYRIIYWVGFIPFSYLRPDISPYPSSLETYDSGHLVFLATVRLAIDRELEILAKESSGLKISREEDRKEYEPPKLDGSKDNEDDDCANCLC